MTQARPLFPGGTHMPKYFVAAALLLSQIFSINAFSQGGFVLVMGSVSAKATAVDIALVTTTLSNKAWASSAGNSRI